MKKLLTGGMCFLLICAGIIITGCNNQPENTETTVAFQELTQDGSATTTTTKLILKFNKDIDGLVATNTSLTSGSTGATKGLLTRTGTGVYELGLSGVTAGGEVRIAVSKTDYTITGSPKTVNIYYSSAKTLKMTIGSKENLTSRITDFNPSGKTLSWLSSNISVATVTNGIVTAEGFTNGGNLTSSSAATGTAIITVTASGEEPNTDRFIINTTMESQVDMMSLTPLKDQFANYFMIGNIATSADASGSAITNTRLTRHYNVLTSENNMKPDAFFPFWLEGFGYDPETGDITYYWDTADRFVNSATGSGFKILAHVLLWHSQIPQWQKDLGNSSKKDEALIAMKSFITDVVTRYKGKIWAWDVLNEVFPDGVGVNSSWKDVMRKTGSANPWYVAIGSDFVYEGYLAARLADPDAILYYNDYNLDNQGKATMVRNMVKDVNDRYKTAYPSETRKLIEGIGMQSHHNTNVSANSIKTSLDMFRALGVRISISEIDVLSQSYGEYSSGTPPTNNQKLQAANLYADYFKLFIDNADIIDRVTFWGVYDEQSWRSSGLPLIFEGATPSKAKPAYYRVVGALE
jgi:endo-1,4-beta-xylanase